LKRDYRQLFRLLQLANCRRFHPLASRCDQLIKYVVVQLHQAIEYVAPHGHQTFEPG